MKEKTVFEKIADKELPAWIVYEDEKHIAFLSIVPFEKGHIVLCPKKAEYKVLWEMPEEEYIELYKVAHKIAKHLQQKLSCGMNIFQNNLAIAHQSVPHIHVNIVPRQLEKDLYQDQNFVRYSSQEEAEQFHELLKMM